MTSRGATKSVVRLIARPLCGSGFPRNGHSIRFSISIQFRMYAGQF
jgi:hypothetical protein